MGWRFRLSDKTVQKFAELPIYCQRQKCSPGNVVSDSIRFMHMFAGVCWRGGVKWEWGSLKMAIFASFVHCLPNILHTWPHDSFQVIRLSMTFSDVNKDLGLKAKTKDLDPKAKTKAQRLESQGQGQGQGQGLGSQGQGKDSRHQDQIFHRSSCIVFRSFQECANAMARRP